MLLPAHWVNGAADAQPSPLDRGFLYGDGLFETLRYYRGDLHLCERHLRRLQKGCTVLGISYPEERILAQLHATIEKLQSCSIEQACIRLSLTRGVGQRGYAGDCDVPTLVVSVFELALKWGEIPAPVRMICTDVTLPDQALLAGIKHSNRLEQVLAARQVRAAGADEGLMLNPRGELVCATAANVYLLFSGVLLTPPVQLSGIAGIVRELLLEALAPAQGIDVREATLPLADIQQADEMFLSNSLLGIQSVAALGDIQFKGRQMASSLRAAFRARVEQECN